MMKCVKSPVKAQDMGKIMKKYLITSQVKVQGMRYNSDTKSCEFSQFENKLSRESKKNYCEVC